MPLAEVTETNATDALHPAAATGPQSAAGFYNRAIKFAQCKEYDKALADLNEAITLIRNSPLRTSSAAKCGSRRTTWTKRSWILAKRSGSIPKARLLALASFAWAAKKKYDKAIDDYNEAIRLEPQDARSYYGRGYAWAAKKEFEKAVTDFDDAIRHDALFSAAYVGRAHAGPARRTTIRRSRTSTMPSGSIPASRVTTPAADMPTRRRGLRQSHRRLQRCPPA